MKQHFTLLAVLAAVIVSAQQIPFINKTSLLPTAVHGGNSIAVCDMNNDGKDDIVRAANGNSVQMIDYQAAANDTFTEASFAGTIGDPWALCVGDYDNNGFNDVMWGDYGSIRMMQADATGSAYTSTEISDTNFIFVQGCNFFDINNDGDLDAFLCNDVEMPHIYIGDGTGGWNFNQSVMPLATFPASDNSGNYASIWTDVNADGLIDLMITHCRQGVTSAADARRIDQVFINNGNATFTQDTSNWTGLRDGAQGWSTAWGDIDNDGDMDAFVLNYDVNSKLMINNGSGVFTNAMSGSGINNTTSIFGENATFQDFNNDGYVDLFISGDTHLMYINNGNGTFTLDQNAFTYANYMITSHAVGDLNGDGFLDMYASYCDIFQTPSFREDRLWMNNSPAAGNTNHWIKFYLQGVASNKNGIGVIVKIYGPWGVQVREVRSGEAYGIQNSFTMHFGLGANTAIDSVRIQWPSGAVDAFDSLNADQVITVVEGSSPAAVQDFDQHEIELSIYPNPVTENAVIRLGHFAEAGLNNLALNIYDMNGKLVYNETALQSSIIVIDRAQLSSGMYFVEITHNNMRVAAKKMMVE